VFEFLPSLPQGLERAACMDMLQMQLEDKSAKLAQEAL
jgi:hypothetical protein